MGPRRRRTTRSTAVGKAGRPTSPQGLVRAKRRFEDPLKHFVTDVCHGKKPVYALLKRATHDEDAVRIVDEFDKEVRRTGSLAGVDLDLVLEALDMEPRIFMGVVSRCAYDNSVDVANAIIAMRYPAMVKASMDRAEQIDATDERRIHFTARGYLPTSKGIHIAVQQNNRNQNDREPEPGEPQSFDRMARRVVRDI